MQLLRAHTGRANPVLDAGVAALLVRLFRRLHGTPLMSDFRVVADWGSALGPYREVRVQRPCRIADGKGQVYWLPTSFRRETVP
jgi:hypothetical protein